MSWNDDFSIGYGAKPAASDHCPDSGPLPTISGVQTASLVRLQERPTTVARYKVMHCPKPDEAMKIPLARSVGSARHIYIHKLNPL